MACGDEQNNSSSRRCALGDGVVIRGVLFCGSIQQRQPPPGHAKNQKKKIFLRDLLDLSYHAGTCMTEHYLRRESVSLLSSNVQVPVLAYYMRLSRNYQISAGPKGKPVIYHIVCMYVPKSYTCARAVPWFPPLRPNPAHGQPERVRRSEERR